MNEPTHDTGAHDGALLDWRTLDLRRLNLIEASAGTGKTYTLVLLLLRLLLERELPPGAIVLATFTENATAELRQRVAERLREAYLAALPSKDARARALAPTDALSGYLTARWQPVPRAGPRAALGMATQRARDEKLLERALAQLADLRISTLHGFCRRVLASFSVDALAADAPLLDDAALTQSALDSAIRQRFAQISARALRDQPLLFDVLDASFLSQLRGAVTRVLKHGQIRLRPAVKEPISDYQATRARLFSAPFQRALSELVSLQNSGTLKLRAGIERDIHALAKHLAKRAASSLVPVKAAIERIARATDVQKQTARVAISSISGYLELCQTCQTLSRAWRAEFADVFCSVAAEVRAARTAHLRRAGAESFDSMIATLALRLNPAPTANARSDALARADARALAEAIRTRFPAALIDEFQDTDALQFSILRAIYAPTEHGVDASAPRGTCAPGTSLILVGDPKQSIFRFRGSDIHTYLRAKRSCDVYQLVHNYRASAALLAAQNQFFSAPPQPFFMPELRYPLALPAPNAEFDRAAPGAGDLAPSPESAFRLTEIVAARGGFSLCLQAACLAVQARLAPFADLVRRKPSIAVLVHRNHDARAVHGLLTQLGVSCQTRAGESVYLGHAADAVYAVMQALAAPNDAPLARAAWCMLHASLDTAHSTKPLAESEVFCLLVSQGKQSALSAWINELARCWQREGLGGLCLALAQAPSAYAAVADFRQLADVLGQLERTKLLDQRWLRRDFAARTQQLCRAFAAKRHPDYVPQAQEFASAAIPENSPAGNAPADVAILTIHSAKGLEFDEVYLPTLMQAHPSDAVLAIVPAAANELFAGELFAGELIADAQSEHCRALEAAESLMEALRLQYVALTRAKQRTCAYFCAERTHRADAPISLADHAQRQTSAWRWHLEQSDQRSEELSWAMTDLAVLEPWREGLNELTRLGALHYQQQTDTEQRLADTLARSAAAQRTQRSVSHSDAAFTEASAPIRLELARARKQNLSFSAITQMPAHARQNAARSGDVDAEAYASSHSADTLSEYDADTAADSMVHPQLAALEKFKGAGFGIALHTLLEHCMATDSPAARAPPSCDAILASLQHNAVTPAAQLHELEEIQALIARTLALELLPGVCLGGLSGDSVLSELSFRMPASAVSLHGLAQLGISFGLGPLLRHELDSTGNHGSQNAPTLRGMLSGAIDLVFQSAGKFYLLDFKSNWLGAQLNDYGQAAMAHAMRAHCYHLQHLLYGLALHRYLGAHYPGYDFERHFGGAHYLFVRACGLTNPPDATHVAPAQLNATHANQAPFGHYVYRAPLALLNALDQMF
jgi:exodeoxyribonuclease V beta subunit